MHFHLTLKDCGLHMRMRSLIASENAFSLLTTSQSIFYLESENAFSVVTSENVCFYLENENAD